jgi:cytoskeleton protein RodZ
MSQFGEALRRERQSRGIALESITDATKISGRHLLALEEDRFEQLPGGVINKGIVRGYARVGGIDENDWVNRFMSAYQDSGKLKDDDANWIQFAENVSKSRLQDASRADVRLRWAGVAALLLLLVGLGWFVWHYVSSKTTADNGTLIQMTGPENAQVLPLAIGPSPSSLLL